MCDQEVVYRNPIHAGRPSPVMYCTVCTLQYVVSYSFSHHTVDRIYVRYKVVILSTVSVLGST